MKLKINIFLQNNLITIYQGDFKKEEIEFITDNINKICLVYNNIHSINNTYKKSKEYVEIIDNELSYVIEIKPKNTPKKFYMNIHK